jgi:hypothetical protein
MVMEKTAMFRIPCRALLVAAQLRAVHLRVALPLDFLAQQAERVDRASEAREQMVRGVVRRQVSEFDGLHGSS